MNQIKKSFEKPGEIAGSLALVLGIVAYIVQLHWTKETLDVKSFSIASLIIGCISEFFFALQGYQKGSPTIVLTRSITFTGFLVFVIIWFVLNEEDSDSKK